MSSNPAPPAPVVSSAPSLVLGCGVRRVGQTYLVSRTRERIDELGMAPFIQDPPIYVSNLADWSLAAQGIGFFIDQNGTVHVTRYVGYDNYPDPTDVIEETIHVLGSTLIPPYADKKMLARLEPGVSKILLFHAKGYYMNTEAILELKRNRHAITHIPNCFLDEDTPTYESHVDPNSPDMCSSLWWQAGTQQGKVNGTREYTRSIGNISYKTAAILPNINLQAETAIIAMFPLDEFHVPVGDGSHGQEDVDKSLSMLEKLQAKLPFFTTEV